MLGSRPPTKESEHLALFFMDEDQSEGQALTDESEETLLQAKGFRSFCFMNLCLCNDDALHVSCTYEQLALKRRR